MNSAKRILVITGVPGTGKTSFSGLLKKRLGDAEVIHVTQVVNSKRLFSSVEDGAKIVKMDALKRELGRLISKSKKGTVILESHLLCDMKIKGAMVLVLREHLDTMRKRLEARGYSKEKMKGNIVSEATDYCGIHAEKHYDYVFESFCQDKQLMDNALKILAGKKPKNRSIDLIPEFDRFLRTNKELAI
jgi:adenylate kinase